MSDKDTKSPDKDKNLIRFPALDKRKSLHKAKKQSAQETFKARKEQESLEEKYRAQYHAQKAQTQTHAARRSAAGKPPFINWQKIPIFTRCAVALFLIVQMIMSFAISESNKVAILYYFGFVPAFYTGGAEWSWSALIAPFTTLILHGSWMHLLFNMVMMLAMGVFFERQFGAKRTAIFFILCGMAGNLAYFLLAPASTVPVIGASGAISGLFAVAFLIMIERGMLGADAQKRGALPFILLWSSIIIGLGLITHDTAWQSHIGGFLGGIGLFHLWKKGVVRL